MGIANDNWPATVGIFTGVLAKEAVVGTLNALYTETFENSAEKPPFHLTESLVSACQTVPENLLLIADKLLDPLGLNIGTIENLASAANEQGVNTATFAAMRQSFNGKAGAFAYLLFILLYAPCVAATAAIYRETNWGWTLFVALWTTSIAYMTATIFYQLMTFPQHPDYSLAWISGLILGFFLVLGALWLAGKNFDAKQRQEVLHDIV
jgi:ferrous iron transport protein B